MWVICFSVQVGTVFSVLDSEDYQSHHYSIQIVHSSTPTQPIFIDINIISPFLGYFFNLYITRYSMRLT